nr:hypothetical protein CFP56_10960 [Quercus suber]POF00892.1 hypothetical protein CFP56_20840 [Quercus suber]
MKATKGVLNQSSMMAYKYSALARTATYPTRAREQQLFPRQQEGPCYVAARGDGRRACEELGMSVADVAVSGKPDIGRVASDNCTRACAYPFVLEGSRSAIRSMRKSPTQAYSSCFWLCHTLLHHLDTPLRPSHCPRGSPRSRCVDVRQGMLGDARLLLWPF